MNLYGQPRNEKPLEPKSYSQIVLGNVSSAQERSIAAQNSASILAQCNASSSSSSGYYAGASVSSASASGSSITSSKPENSLAAINASSSSTSVPSSSSSQNIAVNSNKDEKSGGVGGAGASSSSGAVASSSSVSVTSLLQLPVLPNPSSPWLEMAMLSEADMVGRKRARMEPLAVSFVSFFCSCC